MRCILASLCLAGFAFGYSVLAGPQHWGFGFSYLVTMEQDAAGHRALSAYEPPMRVKDGPWLLRWRDTSEQYKDVMPGCVVVGNFWPQPMGKEHVVALRSKPEGVELMVLVAPESFSRKPWDVAGRSRLPLDKVDREAIRGATAGDLLGEGADQLILLHAGDSGRRESWIRVMAPPASPDQAWHLLGTLSLNQLIQAEEFTGIAAGDFWGNGQDLLVVVANYPGTTRSGEIIYLRLRRGSSEKLGAEIVTRAPVAAQRRQVLVGADFLKDGFAYVLSAATDSPELVFRTAPRLRDLEFNTCRVRPEETFAGAKLDRQQVGESRLIMTGAREAAFGNLIAAGAGRIFGYVNPGCDERKAKLFIPWRYRGYNDAEISFAHRTPMYRLGVPKQWQDDNYPWEPDAHFGWPFKDEEVTYEVAIKNNNKEPILPGKVTVRAWVNRPNRNADVLREGGEDLKVTINEPIPPFDPANPRYTIVPVNLKWPFDLVQPKGWTWKKLNVRDIGERWAIFTIDYHGDENERNDRYELAENGLLFRPVFRFDEGAPTEIDPAAFENRAEKLNTLIYRAPTVTGDPESKEYIGRKLADAVQCMWERSRTSDGQDVWQRVVFDGYRKSYGKTADRDLDWSWVEGPRDLDLWLGLWGDFARFNPRDGGEELHETGHLFHRIGDLYHYFIMPSGLRGIPLGDGAPVQMYTYAWGLDSFCSGHAIISEAGCDLHRYIEGARYGLGWPWHQMLPDKVRVRVLDRDGQPVPQAPIGLWLYPGSKKHSAGLTDSTGLWDPALQGASSAENASRYRVFEPFNLKIWNGEALNALAQVFVVDLPGYSDFTIWGSADTHAHSRYTLMQQALLHPEEWTWDFRTLYKRGAPEPAFTVTAAMRGTQVTLGIDSAGNEVQRNPRYRIYRRWEPTYAFDRIDNGQFPEPANPAPGKPVFFADDMAARDWYMQGRYRAAYYVTSVTPGNAGEVESLPRRVYGIGVERANGLNDLGGGRLLVSLNCGKAEPFGAIFQGTTPAEEYIKHFRFGHTAAKIVPATSVRGSDSYPTRYYATLVEADMPWSPRYFDLIQFDRPDRNESQYPVLHTTAYVDVKAFTTAAPYTVTLAGADPEARAAINAGDWAVVEDAPARILEVRGSGDGQGGLAMTLTLEKPLFKPGQTEGLRLQIQFGGGTPGGNAELRELNRPRGLAVFQVDLASRSQTQTEATEHRVRTLSRTSSCLAIADSGNRRVVVWDATTRFLAAWAPDKDAAFNPAAVVAHPCKANQFLLLDRRGDRASRVLLLEFDGEKIRPLSSQPVAVGDGTGAGQHATGPEMGLAVAPPRNDGAILLALTDAEERRVLELIYAPGEQPTMKILDSALGTFAGEPALEGPTDVAYTVEKGELRLYAVDGHRRVVQLR